jgi:hypothetical protein
VRVRPPDDAPGRGPKAPRFRRYGRPPTPEGGTGRRPRAGGIQLDQRANICSQWVTPAVHTLASAARSRRATPTSSLPRPGKLPRVALDDTLLVRLVLRDGDPGRHERAAVRWLGRFALEGRDITIAELRLAADALDALPDRPSEAMEQLQALCLARGIW